MQGLVLEASLHIRTLRISNNCTNFAPPTEISICVSLEIIHTAHINSLQWTDLILKCFQGSEHLCHTLYTF